MKRNFIPVLATLLAAAALLSGCSSGPCEHQWQEATCKAPKTCTLCGETTGDTIAHHFEDTRCISETPCSMCGTFDGFEPQHDHPNGDERMCTLCGMDKRPADERFLSGLTAGLEERWDILRKYDAFRDVSKEDWERAFTAEFDRIGMFTPEMFQNARLGYWAEVYINSLADAQEALSLYGTPEWRSRYEHGIYHDQTYALYQISLLTPVPVASAYEEELQKMLDNGIAIEEINELCKEFKFLNISDEEGVRTYEAFVENITLIVFDDFIVELDLLDADGEVLETIPITIDDWHPGEEENLRFTTESDFSSMEISYATWLLYE